MVTPDYNIKLFWLPTYFNHAESVMRRGNSLASQKFLAFYGCQMYKNIFMAAHHCTLSCDTCLTAKITGTRELHGVEPKHVG
jgi:hypothetical protein